MNFYFYPPHPPHPPHYLFYDKKNINKNKKRMEYGKNENGGGSGGGMRFWGGVNYSNSTFIVLKYLINSSISIVVLE